MAETEARDHPTTAATKEHDKENALVNVAKSKRARKQTALTKIMAIKAAAAADVNKVNTTRRSTARRTTSHPSGALIPTRLVAATPASGGTATDWITS
eukprot:3704784-Pleurochrysis_carterae.AAC.1